MIFFHLVIFLYPDSRCYNFHEYYFDDDPK